jgi:hypothetical protein
MGWTDARHPAGPDPGGAPLPRQVAGGSEIHKEYGPAPGGRSAPDSAHLLQTGTFREAARNVV